MVDIDVKLAKASFRTKNIEVNFSYDKYEQLLARLLRKEPENPLKLTIRPIPTWDLDVISGSQLGRFRTMTREALRLLTQDHDQSTISLSAYPDCQDTNNDLLRLTAEWANKLNGATGHHNSTRLFLLGSYVSLTSGIGVGYSVGEVLQNRGAVIQALAGVTTGAAVYLGGNDTSIDAIRNRPEAKQINSFVGSSEIQAQFGSIITYRRLEQ